MITYILCGPECMDQYQTVPIRFRVTRRLDAQLIDGGLGGMRLVETPVDPAFTRDYDEFEQPSTWAQQFDMSHWRFFLALDEKKPVGAAALVWRSPEIHMLDSRADLAVLWDLRVHPDHRGQGIGRQLFTRAADFSRSQGLKQMKIETQNINVDACRFYHAMGARLGGIQRFAYQSDPRVAEDVMMLWFLDLG